MHRFVRRQKDIALAQCDASKGEALRYRERMDQLNREIKDLQEALNTERMKMQVGYFVLDYIVLHSFMHLLICNKPTKDEWRLKYVKTICVHHK